MGSGELFARCQQLAYNNLLRQAAACVPPITYRSGHAVPVFAARHPIVGGNEAALPLDNTGLNRYESCVVQNGVQGGGEVHR